SPPSRPREGAGAPVWIFGAHAVLAALANSERPCRRLLATKEVMQGLGGRLEALTKARPDLPRPEIATREQISARLPPGVIHQGIALEAGPLPPVDLDDVCRAATNKNDAVVIALDQVEDPHNVGAVLRSAAAFAAAAVVVTERHSPGETGVLAKAASGALEIVPLVRVTNLVQAMAALKRAGFWIAGLDAAADKTLAEADLTGKIALVLGAEGKGLRRLTRESCDFLVRLPISGAVESLNVSVAAGIALYELRRGARS
ncbi:MAG: 23S rRNA (guanosine(2251)-2'-O)-methyltransferase RlmB, partial [Alphaproteobacteria bacterium]